MWGANQRITVEEAIRVNTLHGAYASKEKIMAPDHARQVGRPCDALEDPHTIDPEKIRDIKIVSTVVGGNEGVRPDGF